VTCVGTDGGRCYRPCRRIATRLTRRRAHAAPSTPLPFRPAPGGLLAVPCVPCLFRSPWPGQARRACAAGVACAASWRAATCSLPARRQACASWRPADLAAPDAAQASSPHRVRFVALGFPAALPLRPCRPTGAASRLLSLPLASLAVSVDVHGRGGACGPSCSARHEAIGNLN
jgi:hypothetical protein